MPPPLIIWEKRFHSDSRKDSESFKTLEEVDSTIKPIPRDMGGTRHCDLRYPQIPVVVHVSRLFIVPKDKKDVRPILYLSKMNTFVMTPKTKMEHLEDTTRLLQEPSWAAKIEIEEVPSSVSPRLDKEGPRLARI